MHVFAKIRTVIIVVPVVVGDEQERVDHLMEQGVQSVPLAAEFQQGL